MMDASTAVPCIFIHAVPIPVLVCDCRGRIQAANAAVLDLLKFGREELLALNMRDIDDEFDRERCAYFFNQLKSAFSCTAAGNIRSQTGDVVSVKYTLTRLDTDDSEGLAVFIQDTSSLLERDSIVQKLEAELHRVSEIAQSANRLKSEFIANMNHDIRTPMNAIIGYAEMLAASDLGEREQRFIQAIRKSGAMLVSILNDVMELAKLEAGRLRIARIPTRLQSLVDEAGKQFREQVATQSLQFTCTVQADLPEVFMLDELHCRQILLNLLSNAFKFTPSGSVTLTVSGTPEDTDAYELEFKVTDTGIGIAAREQKVIFDLLERPDKQVGSQRGKRLGLTLCARLALMMGGQLSLDSEPGKGSTFSFSIPARELGKESIRPVASLPQDAVPAQKTKQPVVLVVDDMPMISDVITDYFADDDIKILAADNSEDGMLLAKSHRPDLILMDLNLAGVDGREVTRRLKKDSATSRIPVVVMTGRMLDAEEYLPVFDDFLAKPFHLAELGRIVDRFASRPAAREQALPAEQSPADQDTAFKTEAWSAQLDKLLDDALVSGSLDAAARLGQAMEIQGRQKDSLQLQQLGRELEQYAAAPDILGVEQLLNILDTRTGERE